VSYLESYLQKTKLHLKLF